MNDDECKLIESCRIEEMMDIMIFMEYKYLPDGDSYCNTNKFQELVHATRSDGPLQPSSQEGMRHLFVVKYTVQLCAPDLEDKS